MLCYPGMPSLHLLVPVLNFKKEAMEPSKQQQEDDQDNTIQPPSPSSSCSSSQEHAMKEDKVKVEEKRGEEEEEGGKEEIEDGYQTPTSPSSKIPITLQCPPAPMKPKWRRRHRRKATTTTTTSYITLVLQAKLDGFIPKKH